VQLAESVHSGGVGDKSNTILPPTAAAVSSPIMKYKMHRRRHSTQPLTIPINRRRPIRYSSDTIPQRDRCTYLWKYGESEDTEVCRVVCGCCHSILWGCCAVVLELVRLMRE